MRNIGKHRYRITIESVSHTQDLNGALVPTYTEVVSAWASKRISRTGQGGRKLRRGDVEYNMERFEFRMAPVSPKIAWDNIVKFNGDRYEIAYITEFPSEIIINCYTSPISNTRNYAS